MKKRTSQRRILAFSLLTSFAMVGYFLVYLNEWDYTTYFINKLYDNPYPGIDIHIEYSLFFRGIRPLENITSINAEDTGKVINDVTSYSYPIEDPDRCLRKLDFFIGIISAPGNKMKRDSIRKTWIKHLMLTNRTWSASYAFLVGRPAELNSSVIQLALENESSDHGDLIQVDLIDSYLNLTFKTASFINWAFKRCGQVRFVIKCDDDVYVNVENLARAFLVDLKDADTDKRLLFGDSLLLSTPTRYSSEGNGKNKWAVTYDQWPWDNYPPYAPGGMYVMSRKALGPLLAATQTTPLFDWEDIYITGLCTSKAKIKLWTAKGLFLPWSNPRNPDGCFVHNAVGWHVDNSEHMEESHSATANYFFRNLSQCLQKSFWGKEKPIIPREKRFEFKLVR